MKLPPLLFAHVAQGRQPTTFRLLLPVGDELALASSTCVGELALVALLPVAGPGAGALAAARWVAGHQLEPAQVVAGEEVRPKA